VYNLTLSLIYQTSRKAQKTKPMKKQILRTMLETNEEEIVSMEFAINKLSSYWDFDKIEKLLESGEILWTPFATYSLYNNKN